MEIAPLFDLKRLHLLRQLSALGSLSKVARAEGLTRPAVSRQIAALEVSVGQVIFERSGRGVRLTPVGLRLAAHADRLFGVVQEIEADLAASARQPARPFRIASLGSAMISILPAAVQEIRARLPGLAVLAEERDSGEALQLLESKQVDIAVFDSQIDMRRIDAMVDTYRLCTDRLVVVCSRRHRLAASTTVSLAALRDDGWALNQASQPYQQFVMARFASEGFAPRIEVSCRNMLTTLTQVETGNLVTVMPLLAARSPIVERGFAMLTLEPVAERDIYLACLRGTGRRMPVSAVISALRRSADRWMAAG